MTLRKIRNLPETERPCSHPEHNPPGMIVLDPGVYEHTCPACGKRTEFVVPYGPSLSSGVSGGTWGGA